MTDYTELLELLRYCSSQSGCIGCKLSEAYDCTADLTRDAAAAIEDMAKHITEMHERVTVLQIARGELEAEVKRLEPKRGKWILCGPVGWPNWKCSVCHSEGRGDYRRCPWCGANMEVQDG